MPTIHTVRRFCALDKAKLTLERGGGSILDMFLY